MNPGKSNPIGLAALALTTCCLALFACSGDKDARKDTEDRMNSAEAIASSAPAEAKRLIEQGYASKRTGRNGDAMAAFEKACALIEKAQGRGPDLASCLDDKASVLLRLGETAKAEKLYGEAMSILEASKGVDPRLPYGVARRLDLVRRMKEKGYACSERMAPEEDPAIPYFPDIGKMQEALGALNPIAAQCKDGIPEAVTIRVFVTGDGVPLRAEARGPHADSDLGRCVEEKIMTAIPEADLPRFRACFRGFTYPYMVGTHRTKSDKSS